MFKSEKGAFLFSVFTTFLFSNFPTFSLSAYKVEHLDGYCTKKCISITL